MHVHVSCESCGHRATLHEDVGCTVFRCRCSESKDRIIADAVPALRRES